MSFAPRAIGYVNEHGLSHIFAGGFTTNGAGAVTAVQGAVVGATHYLTLGGAAFYRVQLAPSVRLALADVAVSVKFGAAIDHTVALADLDPNPNVARGADEFDVCILQAGVPAAPVGAKVSVVGAFHA